MLTIYSRCRTKVRYTLHNCAENIIPLYQISRYTIILNVYEIGVYVIRGQNKINVTLLFLLKLPFPEIHIHTLICLLSLFQIIGYSLIDNVAYILQYIITIIILLPWLFFVFYCTVYFNYLLWMSSCFSFLY